MARVVDAFALLIILLTLSSSVSSYQYFQNVIPNGDFVPHPCKVNFIWWGVGHQNSAGGGARNPFGRDFEENGKVWDACLCHADSDGDGRTNGEELGDPNCVFQPGESPEITTGITHPGVCEPMDSPLCRDRNKFTIDCSLKEFSCPAIDHEEVKSITLTLPNTTVPPQETFYMCKAYELPVDGDYSLIAVKPVIDNTHIMHHMVAHACADEYTSQVLSRFGTASECGSDVFLLYCTHFIDVWSLGMDGSCADDNYGFRIGVNGYKTIVIEYHWTNPLEREDYYDSSGLQFFYTPVLRANDANGIFIGPELLTIPPRQERFPETGNCSAWCTQRMFQNETVYIPQTIPHMHYLGRAFKMELFRSGSSVSEVLVDIDDYSYDNPAPVQFRPHIALHAGDEIAVTCQYATVQKDSYTFYGQGTYDEMCFAMTTYYPNLPTIFHCVPHGGIPWCGLDENSDYIDNCYNGPFFEDISEIYRDLLEVCDPLGINCFAACETAVNSLRRDYPDCLNPNVEGKLYHRLLATGYPGFEGQDLVRLFMSCDPRNSAIEAPPSTNSSDPGYCALNSPDSAERMPSTAATTVLVFYFSAKILLGL